MEPFAIQCANQATTEWVPHAGRPVSLATEMMERTVPSHQPTVAEAATSFGTATYARETILRQAASSMGHSGTLSAEPTITLQAVASALRTVHRVKQI